MGYIATPAALRDGAYGAPAFISLKFHSKMLPEKKSLTLATAAVRLRRSSAT